MDELEKKSSIIYCKNKDVKYKVRGESKLTLKIHKQKRTNNNMEVCFELKSVSECGIFLTVRKSDKRKEK